MMQKWWYKFKREIKCVSLFQIQSLIKRANRKHKIIPVVSLEINHEQQDDRDNKKEMRSKI